MSGFPLARTLEWPVERDGYVLFTHPCTWLRDLDPFARTKKLLLGCERGRDAHVWGCILSEQLPLDRVGLILRVHARIDHGLRFIMNGRVDKVVQRLDYTRAIYGV